MHAGSTWKALAALPVVAGPLWWLARDQRISWTMRCVAHIPLWDRVMVPAAFGVGFLALAATLTFATDAATNQTLPGGRRFIWVVWMIVAAPLAVPLYWLMFVRTRDR